jgi:cell division septation protein DedD
MRRGFGGGEPEEPKSHDTEVTVGPTMMIGAVAGLILLCSAIFGIGYAVGHRSSDPAMASSFRSGDAQAPIQVSGSTTKPGAAGKVPPQPAAIESVPEPTSADNARQSGSRAAIGTNESVASAQPQVRPALTTQGGAAQTGTSSTSLQVQAALSQVQGWLVQVAAVSHPEDAEVLVGALRKRGYAVTVRREISDNLMHVQVGPFATRNDANAMRQKLLNDGYNAIVEP